MSMESQKSGKCYQTINLRRCFPIKSNQVTSDYKINSTKLNERVI